MFLDDKLDNSFKYFYRVNNNLSDSNSNTNTNYNVINSKQIAYTTTDNMIKNINKFKRVYKMNKFKQK